jgi:IS1 family transposase
MEAGKENAFTTRVERWNNPLRQRLARFVCRMLSLSKTETMHEICQRFFLPC